MVSRDEKPWLLVPCLVYFYMDEEIHELLENTDLCS